MENKNVNEDARIFAKNLNYYINQSGKQQKEIALALKFAPTTFNTWCTGKIMPRMGKVQAIADYFGIQKSDLVEDKTGVSRKKIYSDVEKELLNDFRSLDTKGQETVLYIMQNEKKRCEQIVEMKNEINELQEQIEEKVPTRILAYYGRIAAAGTSYGFSDIIQNNTIEVPLTDESEHADFAIGVSGDSMSPTFESGEIVLVQKVERLSVGDIGIFQKDNGIYIKEVGDNELISHNKVYDPIPNNSDILGLGKVIGKVEL